MGLKRTVFLVMFIVSVISLTGCLDYFLDSSYKMRFTVNETGEPLEGNVYNNDDLIGYAENGNFNTSLEKLRPGLISLNGTYNGQPFEFYFEFPRENLDFSGIDFTVMSEDLNKALFDTSVLDIQELEKEIFSLVNEERREQGTKVLKRNDEIALVARDYSKTLSIEGFHHKDLEGKDVKDRVKENKIFYTIVAENLFMIEGLDDSLNISETVVNGWMESPGHRSPIVDRDELFSDGAVGLYCEKKTCYATMVFAGMEEDMDIQLNPGYLTFLYLYDPSFPFDFDVPVSIDIVSTDYVNIYVVSNREQYENLLKGKGHISILENKNTKEFSHDLVASQGNGIIIESSGNSAEVNVHFRYS